MKREESKIFHFFKQCTDNITVLFILIAMDISNDEPRCFIYDQLGVQQY